MRRLSLFALILAMAGCASTSTIQTAPPTAGTSRTFEADFNTTLKAAQEATTEAGLTVESAREVENGAWMIVAKKGVSGFSWGEVVRVMVFPQGERQTQVSVLSQRRVATNVTAKGDYSESILGSLAIKLR